jgi:phage gp29-like protein
VVSGLIDKHGAPLTYKKSELTKEWEEPSATTASVAQMFRETVANGLTPPRLAAILRDAAEENATDFLTLAEEMEERDGHYGSVLSTRKSAVCNVAPIVEAASEDAADQEIAEAVEALIETPTFIDAMEDMLDALGKGYSVVEIVWHTDADRWTPVDFIWRDPRFFQFDKTTRRSLRMRIDGMEEGPELAPGKWIGHVPKIKSGIPIRQGLARLSAWAWLIKSYTLKDWLQFVDVFGMPLRLGRYHSQASEDDKRALLRAVRSIAVDAAAIVPMGMEIEFIKVEGGRGESVFGALAEFVDAQMSKAVLGQTMTTDDGSSLAQAQIHNEVRLDIMKKDARQLSNTINRDLIRPFVQLNFGPQDTYPVFRLPVDDPDDLGALSEQLAKLVPLGLKVGQKSIRDRFGLPEPEDDEELLVARANPAPPPATGDPDNEPDEDPEQAQAKRQPCPSCGKVHKTMARSGEPDTEAMIDQLGRDALAEWEPQMDPLLEPIRALAVRSTSEAEFMADLPATLQAMNAGPLVEKLAIELFKARGVGDAADH